MLNIQHIVQQSHVLMSNTFAELKEIVQKLAVELVPAEEQHVIAGLGIVEQIVQYQTEISII
jgi:hypothetical protein